MKTFSVLHIREGNPPVTGGFPSQRPVTRSFDVFFDLRVNKCLSKQSRRHWFETPSCSLWKNWRCNLNYYYYYTCISSLPGSSTPWRLTWNPWWTARYAWRCSAPPSCCTVATRSAWNAYVTLPLLDALQVCSVRYVEWVHPYLVGRSAPSPMTSGLVSSWRASRERALRGAWKDNVRSAARMRRMPCAHNAVSTCAVNA